eukprot:TRINITY_DN87167_c0_g1_i1.p1 TRINITY_DN87167_c0_g1~~TRINITY_DN87167_c0_g1_i1.p1  ORF type:complete len:203 (+),score=60.17 TRINITY_DN87167_c0_g1_i1:33-641(+)
MASLHGGSFCAGSLGPSSNCTCAHNPADVPSLAEAFLPPGTLAAVALLLLASALLAALLLCHRLRLEALATRASVQELSTQLAIARGDATRASARAEVLACDLQELRHALAQREALLTQVLASPAARRLPSQELTMPAAAGGFQMLPLDSRTLPRGGDVQSRLDGGYREEALEWPSQEEDSLPSSDHTIARTASLPPRMLLQ